MAINRGARASSHPTPSHFMATLSTLPPTRPLPLHLPHKHPLAQGSFGRSSIVRSPVLSLFVRSSDRSIVRPIVHGLFVRSFVQIIFFLLLCCRNSDRSFVRSFDRSFMVRSSDLSIIRPFVRPNNLFPVVMLPKFRSFVRSIIRSFIVRS
jgi:hypothetical protein